MLRRMIPASPLRFQFSRNLSLLSANSTTLPPQLERALFNNNVKDCEGRVRLMQQRIKKGEKIPLWDILRKTRPGPEHSFEQYFYFARNIEAIRGLILEEGSQFDESEKEVISGIKEKVFQSLYAYREKYIAKLKEQNKNKSRAELSAELVRLRQLNHSVVYGLLFSKLPEFENFKCFLVGTEITAIESILYPSSPAWNYDSAAQHLIRESMKRFAPTTDAIKLRSNSLESYRLQFFNDGQELICFGIQGGRSDLIPNGMSEFAMMKAYPFLDSMRNTAYHLLKRHTNELQGSLIITFLRDRHDGIVYLDAIQVSISAEHALSQTKFQGVVNLTDLHQAILKRMAIRSYLVGIFQERRIPFVELSTQEMADRLIYLSEVHYENAPTIRTGSIQMGPFFFLQNQQVFEKPVKSEFQVRPSP